MHSYYEIQRIRTYKPEEAEFFFCFIFIVTISVSIRFSVQSTAGTRNEENLFAYN
jgi:hypothetical protein